MPDEIQADEEFQFFKDQLLDISDQRTTCDLINLVVNRVASRPHVALARIWLKRPGDICSECRLADDCKSREICLHLVASAGRSLNGENWNRLNGKFRRFPMGARKVGQIAATGEQLEISHITSQCRWIAETDWIEEENIRGFVGQPLIHQGEILGVLAVFLRIPVPTNAAFWQRIVADHVAAAIANARAFEEIDRLRAQLELENSYLKDEVMEVYSYGDIIGQSAELQRVLRQIEVVAPTDASVLILGESGTGKELIAREIHHRSQRQQRQMVRVNCASIPKELYESEFFGHVRGAFTGAVKDRAGRFATADGGTLFLDEIGEIPLDLQSKLLRVLQEGTYERVGEERTRRVDVRIVAATNRDLEKEVAASRFRQDLFYRLNVFPVSLPPLRDRKEDIPMLANHFAKAAAMKLNQPRRKLSAANVNSLQAYDWPGNIRELQNVMERAVITARGARLTIDLPTAAATKHRHTPATVDQEDDAVLPETEMRRRERENLERALQKTNWKVYGQGGAAELIGVKPTTLMSRIRKFGLKRSRE